MTDLNLVLLNQYLIFLFCVISIIWMTIHSIILFMDLKKKFPSETKRIIDLLWEYTPEVVKAIEQYRKVGNVDTMSIQAKGEEMFREIMRVNGIDIDMEKWDKYIRILVESAVNKLPPFKSGVDK